MVNTDESILDKPWVRQEKIKILTAKARLIGLRAISRYLDDIKEHTGTPLDSFNLIDSSLLDEIESPITELETEAPKPGIEENNEPLLIESLKPGDIIPINDVSELALFESQLATEIQPNGIQGLEEKWSTREQLKELVKKFTLNGAKFNGTVTDIQLEVMANPARKLLEANESKQEAKFIFSEKLPYKPSAIRIAAIQSGTIGFTATIGFKSTKGLHGTVQSEIWYSRMSSRSIKDVNRYMTRPVVVECFEANNETVRPGAVPIKRRSLMSEAFQSKLSRRATLR
jgi:hypothetical protein